MSCRKPWYPWPSLATSPYRSPPLAGLQDYIPYPHTAGPCMFKLVVLILSGHMWGPIGVHHLWARPYSIIKAVVYIVTINIHMNIIWGILSCVISTVRDLSLTPVKGLLLLNVRYMWSSWRLDMPVSYSLTKFPLYHAFYSVKVRTILITRSAILSFQKDVKPILQQNMMVKKFQRQCDADSICRTISMVLLRVG